MRLLLYFSALVLIHIIPASIAHAEPAMVSHETSRSNEITAGEAPLYSRVKSIYDTYLRATKDPSNDTIWRVELSPNRTTCDQWTIVDVQAKMSLKAYCSQRYLSGTVTGTVVLVEWILDEQFWTPRKNANGSWCLQAPHGGFLSAQANRSVAVQDRCEGDAQFWLEPLATISVNEHQTSTSIATVVEDIEEARITEDNKSNETAMGGPLDNITIKSIYDTYLGASKDPSNDTNWRVELSPNRTTCVRWEIEVQQARVSLKEQCSGRYLSGTPNGSVELVEWRLADELWTPRVNGAIFWCFQSPHGGYLRAQADGSVSLQNTCEDDSQFFLAPSATTTLTELLRLSAIASGERAIEARTTENRKSNSTMMGEPFHDIMIKSMHDTFLGSSKDPANDTNWRVELHPDHSTCVRWEMEVQQARVSLKEQCSGRYLSGTPNGSVELVDWRLADELWTPRVHSTASWCLQSPHGGYLSAQENGSVSLQNTCDGEAQFTLFQIPTKTITLTQLLLVVLIYLIFVAAAYRRRRMKTYGSLKSYANPNFE